MASMCSLNDSAVKLVDVADVDEACLIRSLRNECGSRAPVHRTVDDRDAAVKAASSDMRENSGGSCWKMDKLLTHHR